LEVFVAFDKILLQFFHLLKLCFLQLVLFFDYWEQALPSDNIISLFIALYWNSLLPCSYWFTIIWVRYVLADGPANVCACRLVFVERAEKAEPLSICQPLAYAFPAQDLFAVHLIALKYLLEGVLLRRIAGFSVVNLLWLFDRVVTSHLGLYCWIIYY